MKRDFFTEHRSRLVEAAVTIRTAFTAAGVKLTEMDEPYIARMAHWYQGPVYGQTRFQDPHSRKLVENIEKKAWELFDSMRDAFRYSGFAEACEAGDSEEQANWPNDDGEKVNVCETFFSEDNRGEMMNEVVAILMASYEALRFGRVQSGAGRPPLLSYYVFIRELHELFYARTKSKGYYEKGATAHGAFIEVVVAAQGVLPEWMKLRERATIANRVLQAFTVEIPA
jgi:hypothetical protein